MKKVEGQEEITEKNDGLIWNNYKWNLIQSNIYSYDDT